MKKNTPAANLTETDANIVDFNTVRENLHADGIERELRLMGANARDEMRENFENLFND